MLVNIIEQLIQYRQGEIMRTCIRASCFLILFTIFSISILLSSVVAQSLPVVQGTYGSPSLPVVQGTYGSPSLPVVQGVCRQTNVDSQLI
jgi:hypothetical protein